MKLRTVFYIDVGDLPVTRATEYVTQIRESFTAPLVEKEERIFLPNRHQGSRVEQMLVPETESERRMMTGVDPHIV